MENEWLEYEVHWWRRSPIPGNRIIMRRWIDGRWEYRAMTDEESSDLASVMAW